MREQREKETTIKFNSSEELLEFIQTKKPIFINWTNNSATFLTENLTTFQNVKQYFDGAKQCYCCTLCKQPLPKEVLNEVMIKE